ncbi:MAG TPA: NAD(P)H-dependent oxidoreductase subunit E [Armatimonadota bacterium]|jgi:NADH-quinone oxidoreductase subunit E
MCQCQPSEALDLAPLDRMLDDSSLETGGLIPLLQKAQGLYGYLPREVLSHISERTDTPLSQIFGVVTFYSQFYLTRRGRCVLKMCDGTACHVRGAPKVIDTIQRELGIAPGETTEDYGYTFEVVYCLGSCGLAPVTVMNDRVEGRMTTKRMEQLLRSPA